MKPIISLFIATISLTAAAADAPLWLRDARISPDGHAIAFTYMGDIYTVPVTGGLATRLTSQPGYEGAPVWSPDSRKIAFKDNRNGNFDIYVMPAIGGTPTRITFNSANETPEAFSPDGEYVYFSAAIQDPASSVLFPSKRLTELYRIPVAGGPSEQVLASAAEKVAFLPDGSGILFQDQKGMENEWRKHHTSSVTRDVWSYDFASGKYTNLTSRPGEDRNPAVHGDIVTILSERNGNSFNLWQFPLSNPSDAKAITHFNSHPVRFLSQADNGLLAFTWDGEIYTMMPEGTPTKLNISIIRDNSDKTQVVTAGRDNSEATVSPDGKQIAFISRGDIFVGASDYSSSRRVTDTPAEESSVAWHPKGRALVYTSRRDGHANIYKASIERTEDPNFSNATLIKEQALFDGTDGIERSHPQYSPDGEKLAYIKNRRSLVVKDLSSGIEKVLTDSTTCTDFSGGFSYQWSPDSRMIAFELIDRKHDPYTDVAIVDVATGTVTNITQTGYFDEAPQWVLDGNAVMFHSDRLGMRNHASWGSLQDCFLVFLNRQAYDEFLLGEEDYDLLKEAKKKEKEKAKNAKGDSKTDKKDKKDKKGKKDADDAAEKASDEIKVELDGIRDRIVRVTPSSSDLSGAMVSKDGETLYYLTSFDKGYDLWKNNLRKKEPSLVKKLNAKSMGMEMDNDGNIWLIGSKAIKKLEPKGDKITDISLSARQTIDAASEREAMFDFVANEEAARFYTKDMHGVDWSALTDHYRKFLPHISNGFDFADMLSEMLGELNVSHTGSGYRAGSGNSEPTASLGLLFDLTWTGNGMKIDEIVAGGPFDKASSKVAKGDIIEKIDGVEITPTADFTTLLNGKAGKNTLLELANPSTGERWNEVVKPVSQGKMDDLLYHRWVRRNEKTVDSLSNGRLGYVHIRSMGDASFRDIYSDILGKYYDRDGIVIDTRWNGGGRLHEDIEVLFSAHKYLTQIKRGEETCIMPSRRWTKPSIMLMCEANYSNAHGTPWVYKQLGLGKLVGTPVPGTMTSVNWVTLQNPDFYFGIPVTGYLTADGKYLENLQLEPDILVIPDPAKAVSGTDEQLVIAVEELMKEVENQK